MRLELKQHRDPDGRLVAVVRVGTSDTNASIRVLEDSEIQLRVLDRRSGEVLREETLKLSRSLEPASASGSGGRVVSGQEPERPVTIADLPAVPIEEVDPGLTLERIGELAGTYADLPQQVPTYVGLQRTSDAERAD